jgi:hypothetical protein
MYRMLTVGLLFLGVSAFATPLTGHGLLSSGYLVEEQANYRISFPDIGKVGVQRDGNSCTVDTYGRSTGCTRMLFPTDIFEAKELSSADGLTLYELTLDLRLVVQKHGLGGSSLYLLKVDSQGDVQKRIPLYADL